MATNQGIYKLFIEGAMEAFTEMVAPITAFSYATDTAGASLNDTIRVPFIASASGSSAFTYANGYSGTGTGVVAKDITLDKLLYQPITITDADMQQFSPEVVSRLGRQAGARLASDVVSASFAAVITAGNFPNSSSTAAYSASAFVSGAALADLDYQANVLKWPSQDRYLIAGTALWQALMTNSSVVSAYAYGGSEAVRDGMIPSIYGFKPIKTTVTLPNSDTGFAVNPNAICLGMAYHQPGSESAGVVVGEKAVDPKTGLVIGLRSWYDPAKATTCQVLECLFGVAKGNGNAIIHIK